VNSSSSMVTKLYEFALVGWNNHHHHAAAAVNSVGSNSRQRMAFISDKLVITQHHHHRATTTNGNTNNWGVLNHPPQPLTPLRSFSSTTPSSSSSSKLSSSRAQNAIGLLPTYLLDARSVTKFHPIHAPNGALQLSVAENQLSELPVRGVVGVVEKNNDSVVTPPGGGSGNNNDGGEEMTLVEVLSQLASSTVPRPSSSSSSSSSSSDTFTFEKDMIYYQPTQGSPGLRSAMAGYLHDLLLSSTSSTLSSSSSLTFNPDNIILGAGCNAVLENLCMCLTEPGDAVMIPTPYYAAFEFDLVARAGCTIVPVNTLNFHDESPPSSSSTTIPPSFYYPNKSSLNHAYQLSMEQTSRPPRVLLLSHPNNPLGICYPTEVMEECIEWCREREVHLISDEIYAGSVYRQKKMTTSGGEEDTFVSAMSLASSSSSSSSCSNGEEKKDEGGVGLGLGPYIHLVYALSKDFALSGLRVGVAYTENEEILVPMQKLNDLCQISSQTQLLVERMLSAYVVGEKEEKFVDVYLKSNRQNIQTRCDKLQSCLTDIGIPHLPADSGLFVWMDFREFLPSLDSSITEELESLSSKEQRERVLYLKLMKEYGLLFTPGMSMRNERPGFFRCVFTAASEEEFELGLERIRVFVEEQRASSGNN
jgi:aspartate/methionine/tyrosine aminotransferase